MSFIRMLIFAVQYIESTLNYSGLRQFRESPIEYGAFCRPVATTDLAFHAPLETGQSWPPALLCSHQAGMGPSAMPRQEPIYVFRWIKRFIYLWSLQCAV